LLNVLLQIANKLGLSKKILIPPAVARQQLCKYVIAATNMHATVDEFVLPNVPYAV
jgi:hypothetical protein